MEIIIAALLLLFVVVSGIMLHAAAKDPPENATVIVLGAAIRGDRPSTMLADRLKSAASYLKKNPASKCVVSGGQGEDEDYPEALVMRNYLVEQGIEESRIYREDVSVNTYQNIELSKALVEKEGLNSTVVIATQEFHQYRAQTFAKRAGFQEIGACTCRSPGYLLGCYWVREFAAICRMTLLGY